MALGGARGALGETQGTPEEPWGAVGTHGELAKFFGVLEICEINLGFRLGILPGALGPRAVSFHDFRAFEMCLMDPSAPKGPRGNPETLLESGPPKPARSAHRSRVSIIIDFKLRGNCQLQTLMPSFGQLCNRTNH